MPASLAGLILSLPPISPCLDISASPSRNLALCTCAGGNGILVCRRGGVGVRVPFGYGAGEGCGNNGPVRVCLGGCFSCLSDAFGGKGWIFPPQS